jgi:asparagine synthase (glutamine-hydrolysing)
MCGIVGFFSCGHIGEAEKGLQESLKTLSQRGPDMQQSVLLTDRVGFGHARLSIIDTSNGGSQPMRDNSGRYTIVFNGEIFNYRELRHTFLQGVELHSTSDTEVLLALFALMGKECLKHLNGFFAFAIYDNVTNEIFLARDRFGIKPLHIYSDERITVFSSEIKAILKFPVVKEIDYNTLAMYLQLNYIPGGESMLKHIRKLNPGHYCVIRNGKVADTAQFYAISYKPGTTIQGTELTYNKAKSRLRELIEEAVTRRLVADVPIGAFLSGGIDSSIITVCAARHSTQLNTFSIGYKDEPYFDETQYALLVANRYKTNHTVFSVSMDDMFGNILSVLDYIDEPFADSSAIAVYLLSKLTAQKVKVALSGDGGDELFAGYNKHKAELRARQNSFLNGLLALGAPLLNTLPKSRHSKYGNLFRQLSRYSEGIQLNAKDRYWRWCTLNSQSNVLALLSKSLADENEIENRKRILLENIAEQGDLNDVLYADTKMVLPGDMLTKVDLMSMANSIEVRVPLLDYTVVDFAFSLPVDFKIKGGETKRILKDAFREDLPAELFTRSKHGFEVPLLKWLKTGLRSLVENDLLEKNFIIEQGIFNYTEIEKLKGRLFSSNPGDVHANVWSLVVFQYWYKKYFLQHA